ncbi:hypothetical protein ASG52_08360 [Methylobacterium sp. Leaf456]|uniref:hypothetical protein n=1 Tax=Methylobacterium sp. Leaf456 TaxID=1736382 RepID=UPI0006FDD203|nr:hypothetical protein [Methylobacterium sp. Leaf456]KQT50070.1 hypothetical protein ASG52_08360 [Methylobacterium sp. Leaf456]
MARLRALLEIVHTVAGPHGREAKAALRAAEADPDMAAAASAAVLGLPPPLMRRVLATYAGAFLVR